MEDSKATYSVFLYSFRIISSLRPARSRGGDFCEGQADVEWRGTTEGYHRVSRVIEHLLLAR